MGFSAASVGVEHGKKQGTTWREEASTLMKQLKKFTPGPTIEQVRQQIATEKLLQMLPARKGCEGERTLPKCFGCLFGMG